MRGLVKKGNALNPMAVMMEFKKPTWESNSHRNTMDTDTREMMWGCLLYTSRCV